MTSRRDAFSILMKGKRDLPQENGPRKSSFILCPLGCGKNVAASSMSLHLDRCPVTTGDCTPRPKVAHDNREEICKNIDETQDVSLDDHTVSYPKPRPEESNATNAYLYMMQHSQGFYRKTTDRRSNIIRQRFHLHDASGKVSWRNICKDNDIPSDTILWESSVTIKPPKDSEEVGHDLELIVSSAVQSSSSSDYSTGETEDRVVLVRQKSKLSVSPPAWNETDYVYSEYDMILIDRFHIFRFPF